MSNNIYTNLYNFEQGKYWITLKKEEIIETSGQNSVKNISHVSDTGQFISNCFFFLEGIDSDKVKIMIDEILASSMEKDQIISITHLKNQDFVASFLFKYVIQNNSCEYNLIIKYLQYLFDISTL